MDERWSDNPSPNHRWGILAATRAATPRVWRTRFARAPDDFVHLDRWGTPVGRKLAPSLVGALQRSLVLVLLISKKALASTAIKDEIPIFSKTERPVIPISVDGALETVNWDEDPWTLIAGAAIEPESAEALAAGRPASDIVDRVLAAVIFVTQSKRLRRATRRTASSVVMLIAAAILVSPGSNVLSACISPDARYAFSAYANRCVAMWHLRRGERLALAVSDAPVTKMLLRNDVLVIGTKLGQVEFFDVRNLPPA